MSGTHIFRIKGNTIIVSIDTKTLSTYIRLVSEAVATALFLEKQKNISIEVYLLTDRSMKEINKTFKHKNTVTNVLSFECPSDPVFSKRKERKKHVGEIYLAPRYITRKKEDIVALSLHGALHLLGYDHKKRDDRKKMEKREGEIYVRVKRGK